MTGLDLAPFTVLSAEARERLTAGSRPMRIAEGDSLIQEGERDSGAYVLLDGTLRVLALAEGRTLAVITPPALIGEMALVSHGTRTATVVADAPCALLFVPSTALREAMDADPVFAQALRERVDLLAADAFLKRRSPFRDLPTDIVAQLVRELRPKTLAAGQVLETDPADLYLVRDGSLERLRDGAVTPAGGFIEAAPRERYAAREESAVFQLRAKDVVAHVARHQERLRRVLADLRDADRVRARPGTRVTRGLEQGDAIVYDGKRRALVSRVVAELVPFFDGTRDLAAFAAAFPLPIEQLRIDVATLIVADLVTLARRRPRPRP